jgi:hypothetical protein
MYKIKELNENEKIVYLDLVNTFNLSEKTLLAITMTECETEEEKQEKLILQLSVIRDREAVAEKIVKDFYEWIETPK